jgi:hypothetical protein
MQNCAVVSKQVERSHNQNTKTELMGSRLQKKKIACTVCVKTHTEWVHTGGARKTGPEEKGDGEGVREES